MSFSFLVKLIFYTLYFKVNAKISSAKYFATKRNNAKNLLMYKKLQNSFNLKYYNKNIIHLLLKLMQNILIHFFSAKYLVQNIQCEISLPGVYINYNLF